jgi:hypothetical protein
MSNFLPPVKPYEIDQTVHYTYRDNPCRVIATQSEPHKLHFNSEILDSYGHVLRVPEGFDYIVIETGIEFSPYISVKASELRQHG